MDENFNLEYYKAQNILLEKKIIKLEGELFELKDTAGRVLFKNKIKEFIKQIENNDIQDVNKALFLYINNIKNDLDKIIKNNVVVQL